MPGTGNAEPVEPTERLQQVMTRAEHLAWAKERALEYVDHGDLVSASASMGSDLSKHPELADHAGIKLMMLHMMAGLLNTPADMRHFIEGFN